MILHSQCVSTNSQMIINLFIMLKGFQIAYNFNCSLLCITDGNINFTMTVKKSKINFGTTQDLLFCESNTSHAKNDIQ